MAKAKDISTYVRARIREIRESQGMTQKQLADRASGEGFRVDHTVVAKIESGARRLSIEEMVALAYCLNVSPLALLPIEGWQMVRVAGGLEANASAVRSWWRGYERLDRDQDASIFFRHAPPGERAAREAGVRIDLYWHEIDRMASLAIDGNWTAVAERMMFLREIIVQDERVAIEGEGSFVAPMPRVRGSGTVGRKSSSGRRKGGKR